MPKKVLAWSPNSSYLFTASPDGSFEIWETENWTHSSWTSSGKGEIVNAKWVPDSKTLLLAYTAGQVVALMLIGEPPSLNAQLLPVDIPELHDMRQDSQGIDPISLYASRSVDHLDTHRTPCLKTPFLI